MNLEMHQKASDNFNHKIEALLSQLRFKSQPNIQIPIDPNVHIAGHFDESNIIGELKIDRADYYGKINGKTFTVRNKILGLFDRDYKDLTRIAESLQSSTKPKNVISLELISDLIFEWIKLKYFGKTALSPIEFILSECEKHIEEAEIWIPIANLHIQAPFELGKVTFKAITKDFMDNYENSSVSKATKPEEIRALKIFFGRKRSKIQNLAVATMKIEAEKEQAYKIAYEETEKAVSVLRFFSPTNLFPTKICYVAPIDKQHMDKDVYLVVKDGKVLFDTSGFTDKSDKDWNIYIQDLDNFAKTGLGSLGKFLTQDKLTDFQQKVLEAIFIYSKACLAKELSDRLIYTLVALETVFLKDSNEPIQDNISLRMAFMHYVSVDERKRIIKNIKETYSLRSSFIHHGQNPTTAHLEILKDFMYNAWMSLQGLIPLATDNITKAEFFEELENRRVGG